jgi:pimeloyl-ACP methyl ester carboxylesterase
MTTRTDKNVPLVEFASEQQNSDCLVLFLAGLTGSKDQWSLVVGTLDTAKSDVAYGAPIMPNQALAGANPEVVVLADLITAEVSRRQYTSVVLAAHSVGSFVALAIARRLTTTRAVILVNGGLMTVAEFLDAPVRTFIRRPRTCLTALKLFVLAGAPAPERLKQAIAANERFSRRILGNLVSVRATDSVRKREALIVNGGGFGVIKALWWNRHHWSQFLSYADEIEPNVRFLVGDRDPMATVPDSRAMANLLPHATVEILGSVGHAAPLETAVDVGRSIEEFVPA